MRKLLCPSIWIYGNNVNFTESMVRKAFQLTKGSKILVTWSFSRLKRMYILNADARKCEQIEVFSNSLFVGDCLSCFFVK